MMRAPSSGSMLLSAFFSLLSLQEAMASQAVFSAENLEPHLKGNASIASKPFGRFIHITDLHPDPHYKHGSAVRGACHHKKPKKKKAEGKWRAGWWGTGVSDCDSPHRLIESSLDWVSKNWLHPQSKQEEHTNLISSDTRDGLGIDFIIWTGDSARHDNDDKLPRTNKEIFDLNRWTLNQVEKAFPGVPIVPTIGNNDIFPHNILFPGPNSVTKEYVQIWQDHIPEYEFHTFEQGGYFVKELLPNRLSAMSLNTLYFYDNNKAVDGCIRTKKRKGETQADPGTAQLDWLEVQLGLLRSRGMQAHLLGHVPPTAGNYFPRCYKRYTDIVLRYQDTIVGQHFGHMNVDAFFIQEDQEAVYGDSIRNQRSTNTSMPPQRIDHEDETKQDDGEGLIYLKDEEGLPGDLRQDFSTLPGRGRTNEDYYSVFYIAPSIIPTYYPSIRVWTYNTSEENRFIGASIPSTSSPSVEDLNEDDAVEDEEDHEDDDLELPIDTQSRHHHRPTPPKKRKGKKHRKKKRKKPLPRHASPDSPSRTNTYLSLLGYSQWVMDIDAQNEEIEKILHPKSNSDFGVNIEKKKNKKHNKDQDEDEEERKRREKEAEKASVSYRLEYTTYEPATLWREYNLDLDSGSAAATAPLPVPKHLLDHELKRAGIKEPFIVKEENEEEEQSVLPMKHRDGKKKRKLSKALRKFTDYSLPSMTVSEMMDLGRRLMVDKKLWKRFKRRIYSESGVV